MNSVPERQILCRHLHTLICRLFHAFLTEIDAYEHDYNSQDSDLKGARQTELPLCFAEIILTPK